MKRRAIFNENHKKMVEHNKRYAAGEVSWSMGMTDEMDLTEAEWLAKRTGGLPYYDNTTVFLDTLNEEVLFKMSQVKKTPRDFNWVDQGGVSSVKNQAQCGSCAAFAAVGAIESCTKITVGNMADDLSEQHLLDCAYNHVFTDGSGSWGCYGCDGAWLWSPGWPRLLAHQELLGQKLGRERLCEGEEGHRALRCGLPPPDRPHLRLNQPNCVSSRRKAMFEKF